MNAGQLTFWVWLNNGYGPLFAYSTLDTAVTRADSFVVAIVADRLPH